MADENQVNVAITATSDQLEEGVNAAADSVSAATDKMTASVEHMAESTVESTEASESAFRRMSETISESVTEMNEKLEGFSKSIALVGKSFALLGEVAMLGFVGEKLMDLGKEFAEFGEQTEIASKKTGLSTTTVQELGFAANMTGVSAEGMNQAMMRLSRAMTSAEGGSKPLQASFEALGISSKSLEDMSLDQVLAKVADKFAATEDGSTKAAIAMQLFGRQGSDLIPLLDKGASGIAELRQRAEDLGVVMGADDVEAGAKLNEQLKEMDAQMSALKLRAGAELAPAMSTLVELMSQGSVRGGTLDTMFVALGEAIRGVTAVVLTVVTAFEQMGDVINGVAQAANRLGALDFKGVGNAMSTAFTKAKADGDAYTESLDKLFSAGKKVQSLEGAEEGGPKGKLQAPDAGGGAGPSQVELWKTQLQQQEEASGQYFKDNLKDEEAFWEQKLSLVKAGSKDYVAIEHELYQVKSELAHQSLAEDLGTMREEMADAQSGSLQKIEIASREADRIGQAYGYQSAQYKTALAEMLKAGKEYSDAQVQLVADGIQRQEQQQLAGVARAENADKAKFKAGQESSAQETANLIAEENERYAIETDALAREMALYQQDSKEYQKLLDEKLKATEAHTTQLEKINQQGAQQTQTQWNNAFKTIDSTMNSSVLAMIKGTQTLQQSMIKVADQILNSMIKVILEMAERWIAGEAQKIAASQGASAVLNALGLQDAITSRVTQTATATTDIASQAAIAGAGAYAATAAIPYVGPALAPAAGMEAFASVMAYESMASAAGGFYNVPENMLANIHKDEMVLPSWAAQGVRSIIQTGQGGGSGAAGGGGGGGMSLTYAPQIGGVLGDSQFKGMLAKHSDAVYDMVKQAIRDGRR
ncbi:hypothetical protein [Paraburkholderia sp.]|uniref:hypothetical protein n=1 Tax=Paraburkholderia sp. TaxID=1926495 RepID=UPI003C7CDBA8